MSQAWPDSRTPAVGRPRGTSNVWSRLTRWTGVSSVSTPAVRSEIAPIMDSVAGAEIRPVPIL
jgi:hypothetical protein